MLMMLSTASGLVGAHFLPFTTSPILHLLPPSHEKALMITPSGGDTSALNVGEAAKQTHIALGEVPDPVCVYQFL